MLLYKYFYKNTFVKIPLIKEKSYIVDESFILSTLIQKLATIVLFEIKKMKNESALLKLNNFLLYTF